MIATILKKDVWFYPALFTVWAMIILMRHMGFAFYGTPLPSVSGGSNVGTAFQQKQMIDESIAELQSSLAEEQVLSEKGHIQHNIGTAYYDLYKATTNKAILDSVRAYYQASIASVPDVARFYYNLGRIYTESRNHPQAKVNYEKALELKSDHVLALHNLALLNYFELGLKAPARELLTRAISLQQSLPICNYVLGEIALEDKTYEKARDYFTAEVNTHTLSEGKKGLVPVSGTAKRYAAMKSHYRLALLYSTRFVDSNRAQAHLHAYLRLEPDEKNKKAVIKEMQKYWQIKGGK